MKYPPRDQKVIDAVFDVWLSRDMQFNNSGGIKRYPRNTKAQKVKYTKKILRYLDNMEANAESSSNCITVEESGRAVSIKLDGKVRYVWRADVLTEREWHEKRASQKEKLEMLRKESRGPMGEG